MKSPSGHSCFRYSSIFRLNEVALLLSSRPYVDENRAPVFVLPVELVYRYLVTAVHSAFFCLDLDPIRPVIELEVFACVFAAIENGDHSKLKSVMIATRTQPTANPASIACFVSLLISV